MMRLSKIVITAAAATLAMAPMTAHAAPVSRAAAPTAESSDLVGDPVWIVAVVAILLGLYFVLDDDSPTSP